MEEFEGTFKSSLGSEIYNKLMPIKAFYDLLDGYVYESNPEIMNACLVLKPLLNQLDEELEKVCEIIDETLGKISLEGCCHGDSLLWKGKNYVYGEYIRAIFEPIKESEATNPGCAAPEASREDFRQAVRTLSKLKNDPAGKLMDKLIDISLQDEAGRIPAQAFEE
ncbi:MAG: hypothetical protein ACYDEQ_02205, partial [Desulfocucumaceae bacterium]